MRELSGISLMGPREEWDLCMLFEIDGVKLEEEPSAGSSSFRWLLPAMILPIYATCSGMDVLHLATEWICKYLHFLNPILGSKILVCFQNLK